MLIKFLLVEKELTTTRVEIGVGKPEMTGALEDTVRSDGDFN
jgi:hypothetical protein